MTKKATGSKTGKVGKSQGARPSNRATAGQRPATQPRKGWEFAAFTKKSVNFNKLAQELSHLLHKTYGDTVSITQFERFLAALPSMEAEKRAMLHLDTGAIALYEKYKNARDQRDTERETFRSDIAVTNVEGGLATAKAIAEAMDQGGP